MRFNRWEKLTARRLAGPTPWRAKFVSTFAFYQDGSKGYVEGMNQRWWLLLLLAGVPGWACSCGALPSAKDAWAGTPVVFLGRVEKTEQRTFPYGAGDTYIAEQEARVVVEEAFKGVKAGERLALEQPGHNCAPKFKEGDRVLFYLHPTKAENVWEAYGCHRTRSLAKAADDLLFLRALPWAAARTPAFGRSPCNRHFVRVEKFGGHPGSNSQ